MSERRVYHVNLNGQSALRPRHTIEPEYEGALDYCLDAPSLLPAGSTRYMFSDDQHLATIPSISHREWHE